MTPRLKQIEKNVYMVDSNDLKDYHFPGIDYNNHIKIIDLYEGSQRIFIITLQDQCAITERFGVIINRLFVDLTKDNYIQYLSNFMTENPNIHVTEYIINLFKDDIKTDHTMPKRLEAWKQLNELWKDIYQEKRTEFLKLLESTINV